MIKVKVTAHHEGIWRGGGLAPLLLNLKPGWRWGYVSYLCHFILWERVSGTQ